MALLLVWVTCAIAAYLYSQQQNIPSTVALSAFPAFLLEATFFYILCSERLRARLEKLPSAAIATVLTLAAVAPYCAASLALGSFRWESLGWLAALAATASFWYVLLPQKRTARGALPGTRKRSRPAALCAILGSPTSDILFLSLMALVTLAKVFHRFYLSPHPKLPLETLGQLMWIRTGAFALLSVRQVKGVGFGFWPAEREWKIGAAYYALFVPVAAALAWAIGFARPHAPALDWERATLLAAGTFFGVLWVVALGEEFFFRGLLQQWITAWLSSEASGLLAASILFGCVHLWFRAFPNWRFAALAAVAGLFYGLAFRQARSIRASMVTHALTVTTWRMFFS
jgi:membrane protease YdiL (CAAX protease family)